MDKVDRIIDIIRNLKEEMAGGGMMTTGSSGGTAGFSAAADPKGPVAGYDKVMGLVKRRKGIIGKGKFAGARTRWKKGLE